jgi:hypothetical protein
MLTLARRVSKGRSFDSRADFIAALRKELEEDPPGLFDLPTFEATYWKEVFIDSPGIDRAHAQRLPFDRAEIPPVVGFFLWKTTEKMPALWNEVNIGDPMLWHRFDLFPEKFVDFTEAILKTPEALRSGQIIDPAAFETMGEVLFGESGKGPTILAMLRP